MAAPEVRLPKATKVKNKQPASRQITAEQILRESKEIQLEDDLKAPRTVITDPDELAEYQLRKRKEYEDTIRRVGRWQPSIWVKYATWEEQQRDFRRARSVWERALDNDYRNTTVWLKYAEMEMRHRFINHARNVWDRAVSLLPRVDQLWYKYVHMEEMLGNVAGARQVFERWMRFEPDHQGWMAYIRFELRYDEVQRAREIYERYVEVLPTVQSWVRYAKFELKFGNSPSNARACYERALDQLGEDANTEEFYLAFSEFEERVKEPDRARAILRYGLDHLPKAQAQALYERLVSFEKQHGDREGIEEVVVSKRRFAYEEQVKADPLNYDAWFDYIKLEESTGDAARIREVYERAVANLPPRPEKRYWQRYVYLWIKYALWEELEGGDMERAREVYRAALKLVPHASFTFGKLWILAANLEVRAKRLDAARRILGMALGVAPKGRLFKHYINMEYNMGNIDRCRTLYEKYLEWGPSGAGAWARYAELEASLDEGDRARAIYELAISQPLLDMPEALWKGYIDFEIGQGQRERARVLYERLLDRTSHVKVWLSFAKFEAEPLPSAADADGDAAGRNAAGEGPESPGERATRARAVYERAYRSLREGQPGAKEEAAMLLDAWRAFEAGCTTFRTAAEVAQAVAAVEKKMPKRVKRKRPITTDDGAEVGMEEYYDYVFPEEAGAAPNLKLLEAAYRWKRQKADHSAPAAGGGGGGGSAGGAAVAGNAGSVAAGNEGGGDPATADQEDEAS